MKISDYPSVSEFCARLREKFESDYELRSVVLHGELSDYKRYPSGHAYFTLKDADSILPGVMWRSYAERLDFSPKDGDEVLVHGSVTIYPKNGRYQIYVDRMALFGVGAELLKLKALTKKLSAEGLFDPSRKRPIPRFPSTVGIVTARGSAAIKDMVVNLQRRWPMADIIVFPSLVQGKGAPEELLKAVRLSQSYPIDVLIIGRGGGSSEDLSAFNDEALVRALAASKCPTISAVGHEIDTSLTDLVADLRVSTPTGAAVAAVPDKNDVVQGIDQEREALFFDLKKQIEADQRALDSLKSRPFFQDPARIYRDKIDSLHLLQKELLTAESHRLEMWKKDVGLAKGKLSVLSPYSVLGRGYSILEGENGEVITSAKQAKPGQVIINRMEDGVVRSIVQDHKEEAK